MKNTKEAVERFLTVDYFYGDGVLNLDGRSVYMINGVPTIITVVSGDYAKGYILNDDLTVSPCYVVKEGRYFAHGSTLADAVRRVLEKWQNGRRSKTATPILV